MTRIRNVIFDIGRVLVHVDHQPFVEFLRRRGVSFASDDELAALTQLRAYECGTLEPTVFFRGIRSLMAEPSTVSDLQQRWNAMLSPDADMLDFARALSNRRRVGLLSNIGPDHLAYASDRYGVNKIGSGVVASCKVGAWKPEPEIFRYAEAHFDLRPEQTVFIDDAPANISAARDRGWHTILHESPHATRKALLGLRVG